MLPQPNETQPQFAIRFHESMRDAIPETDARNAAMLDAWRKYARSSALAERAIQRFGKAEYQHVNDVPVFAEHETVDGKGQPQRYGRDELAAMVDRCNHRILDTGDYAPLTEGHTPDPKNPQATQPNVMGYSGNFRLGMIGNEQPRWAIFADEYRHAEEADKFARMRRRSPEVWLEKDISRRFFDPIAVLGATTPRLDMGQAPYAKQDIPKALYSIERNGETLEKYAFPGPFSMNIPSHSGIQNSSGAYAAQVGAQPSNTGEEKRMTTSTLTPDDIEYLIGALMDTEPMQWVQSQMVSTPESTIPEEQFPPEQPPMMNNDQFGVGVMPPEQQPPIGLPPSTPVPGMAPPASMPGAATEPPVQPMMAAGMGTQVYECGPKKRGYQMYQPNQDDAVAIAKYAAGEIDEAALLAHVRGVRETYSKEGEPSTEPAPTQDRDASRIERAKYAALEQEHESLKARVEGIENERRKAERYAKLTELRRYSAFDLEKEAARCDPAKMSDEVFDDHLDVIAENYAKIPADVPSLYTPDIDAAGRDSQPTEEDCQAAAKYAMAERKSGKHVEYADALEHVMNQKTGAAQATA